MRKLQVFTVCSLLASLAVAMPANAISMTRSLVTAGSVGSEPLGYIEYKPTNYSSKTNWPIIIFLHGAGEYGDGSTNTSTGLPKVENQGLAKEIAVNNRAVPAVVIAPQSPSGFAWDAEQVDQLVTYVLSHYNVDVNRLYMTGLSMGGGGTWKYINAHMDRLAAAAPICPPDGLDSTKAAQLVSQNLPIWAFHSYDDGTCSYSVTSDSFREIARARGAALTYNTMDNYPGLGAVRTAHVGPTSGQYLWDAPTQTYKDTNNIPFNPPQMFTLWPSGGHQWDPAYQDNNLYDWLLSQTRAPVVTGLLNGSFEAPTLAANAFSYNPTGGSWTFANLSGIARNGSGFFNVDAPDGKQAALVQTNTSSGSNGVITQNVTLGAGTYVLNFKVARRGSEAQAVKVSVGSTVVKTITPTTSAYEQVTSDPINVTAGTYTIKFEASSTSGDVTAFIDDVKMNQIPETGTGLQGEYYATKTLSTLVKTQTDPIVAFDFGTGSPKNVDGTTMSSISADNFSIRWSGQVKAVETGAYTFTTATDDGVRLWVNGSLLIDRWVGQSASPTWSGSINLVAGQKYNIKMEYFEDSGFASAKLYWTRPGGASTIIPQSQLYPTTATIVNPTIANAGFEAPATSTYSYDPSGGSWTFSGIPGGGSGVQKNGSIFGAATAPDGTQTGFLQNTGSIVQSVNFTSPSTYTITYKAAQRPTYNSSNQSIKLTVGGNVIDTWTPPSLSFTTHTSPPFSINAPGNVSIKLEGTVSSGDSTAFIDSVSF